MDIFPPNYKYALTSDEHKHNWPNLQIDVNFEFKSRKRRNHNCVGWAIDSLITDLDMLVFKSLYKLDEKKLDHSIYGYAKILNTYYQYEFCDNDMVEEGIEKIALYGDLDNDFKHIARQLSNGRWVSKMGELEDIEHYDLDCLVGDFYGYPKLFMKRGRSHQLLYASY